MPQPIELTASEGVLQAFDMYSRFQLAGYRYTIFYYYIIYILTNSLDVFQGYNAKTQHSMYMTSAMEYG